jgi:hypothetical protein
MTAAAHRHASGNNPSSSPMKVMKSPRALASAASQLSVMVTTVSDAKWWIQGWSNPRNTASVSGSRPLF